MSASLRMRRQWQIQEGPQGPRRRLRSQMAEEGCVQSQVVVARHLLDESQDGNNWTENTTKAVYWLIKASEMGNAEATNLLKKCFKSGTGVTEENYNKVKKCVKMSQEEHAFRSAAKELFVSLTPLGQLFVTTEQLKATLPAFQNNDDDVFLQSCDDHFENTDCNDGQFNKWYQDYDIFEGKHLSEEKLVDIAGQVSRGELPSFHLDKEHITKRRPNQKFLFQWVIDLLLRGLTVVSTKVMDVVAEHGDTFLSTLLPLSQIRTLLVLLILSCIPLDGVFYVLPLFGFYVSLLIMAIANLQMVCNIRRLSLFVMWLSVFTTANNMLDTGDATMKFHKRRLLPYAYYFMALTVMLCCRPFCTLDVIFFSELTVLSFGFAVLSFVALNISFTRHVWAFAGSVTLVMVGRFVDQETVNNYWSTLVGIDVICMEFGDKIVVNIGVNLFPVLILIFVFIWMAFSNLEGGFYHILLPNLVCLMWLHITGIFLPLATWFGIVRSIAACTAIIMLPVTVFVIVPLLLATGLLKITYMLWESAYFFSTLCSATVIALSTVGKWMLDRRGAVRSGRWKKCLFCIQLMCGALAAFQFMPIFQNISFAKIKSDSHVAPLDWKTYHDLCYYPNTLEYLSTAKTQENCLHLSGIEVRWKGQVQSVKTVKVSNLMEDTLKLLPTYISDYLKCSFGTAYDEVDSADSHLAKIFRLIKLVSLRKCHLSKWNVYEFTIDVHLGNGNYWSSVGVSISADNSFREFAFQLLPSDEIEFKGILAPVSGIKPTIKAIALSCIDCVHAIESTREVQTINFQEKCELVLNFIFNFLFFPYFELKQVS